MTGLHLRHFPGDPRRPALALHCMMGSGAGWGGVAEALPAGRSDLFAPDLPGHGRSAGLPDGLAPGAFADAVAAGAGALADRLCDAAADGRVDLIGHSFGGVAALRLAVARPDRVRSLTLVEPVMFAALPAAAQDPDRLLDRLAALTGAGDMAGATAAFLAYWDGPDLDRVSAPTRDQLVAQMRWVMDTMGDVHADRGGILRPGGLESIDAPVLLVAGEGSPPVIGQIAAALAARLPNAARADVAGARHMAPLTHPAAVARLIAQNMARGG